MTAPSPHEPQDTAPASSDDPLKQELRLLLAECHARVAERQALLAPYFDADGDVNEEFRAEYDEARITIAIEAGDWLDTLTARLEQLAACPSTYTVTYAGPATLVDAEAPSSFAVYADSLEEARRVVQLLPSFQRWYRDQIPDRIARDPVIQFVADQSHAGLRAPGEYNDLRLEQAAWPLARSCLRPQRRHPASPPPPSARRSSR